GNVLGVCPTVVSLSAGEQRLFGQAPDGRKAVGVIDVDPAASGQSVELVPFRAIDVSCAQPDAQLSINGDILEGPVTGTCGELADSGLKLPDGTFALVVELPDHQPRESTFDVGPNGATVDVEALERLPVDVRVECAQSDAPPVMVRLGKLQGACPLTGQVPEGTHLLEARRDGH